MFNSLPTILKRFSLVVLLLIAPSAEAWADVYVSPQGDDAASGTRERPLRTLEAARDAVRKSKPSSKVTVWLRGGVYPQAKTFTLTREDSAGETMQIVYRAVEGERPVLLAGRKIQPGDFKKPTDPAVLKRLPARAHGHVIELDGQALGLKHLGPWPNLFTQNGGLIELLFNGVRMPMARWPNEAPATMKRVLDVGDDSQGPNRRGGTFEYRDDRHAAWPLDEGVYLRGYWRVPWQIETVRIQALDREKKTITLAAPVQGGIGSKYHRPHGSGKEPYQVVNQLEELDELGEWCLDFRTKKILFWPPADPRTASFVIADLETPVIACKDVARVVFQGLTLEGGLGNAVEITGGQDVLVAGCTIQGFGQSGVLVRGGGRHGVTGCDILRMGDSGIVLEGGDRSRLIPARHFATNNHIHHYGQVKTVYSAGINAGFPPRTAVGVHVANNLVHDAPHAGILYGGNDNVLEQNEIHHVCLLSDDMGGLYTWYDWTSQGNVVRNNFIHHSPKAHGVYCDDGDSGDAITGNVMLRLDTGVFIGGGHDNIVAGNLVVDCKVGLHIDARGVQRGYNAANKTLVGKMTSARVDQPPWRQRYPTLAGLLKGHPELPTGDRFENNVLIGCKRGVDKKASAEELRFVTFGKNLEKNDPGFRLDEKAMTFPELPGFKPIAMKKIGLVQDAYRKSRKFP